MSLAGEWEFYWKQLINPGELTELTKPDTYAKVPSYWTSYKNDIENVEAFGYGTYRLRIIFPGGYRDSLCLKIPIFDTSFDLFLNGDLVASNGKTGISAETSKPGYYPIYYSFYNDKDTLDILVHVSNFSHRRGGFWMDMKIGTKELMIVKNERHKVLSYGLIGIFFGTFLLFMVFYILEKKNLSFLYFSLTTLGLLFRMMNTGLYPANYFFNQDWLWTVRLEYLGTFVTYIFGMFYLNQVFPSKKMAVLTKINACVFLAFSIVVLFFTPPVFSYAILILEVSGAMFLLYYVLIGFLGMLKKKLMETAFFFSVLVLLLALINDSLVAQSKSPLNFEYLLPMIFVLFIIIQALLVITLWVKNYKEKTAMHAELEYINRNLENIISKRTEDLNISNEELKSTLAFKTRIFSIIAHDLKSPVASLAQHSDLLVNAFPEGEHSELMADLKKLAYSSIDLIENLLYWGRTQEKKIQYHPLEINVYDEFTDQVEIFDLSLRNKNIEMVTDAERSLTAFCDTTLLRITLRNLISNAIKFSPANSKIYLTAEQTTEHVQIEIRDMGIGMDEDKISRILNDEVDSTFGTSGEKGTGLGLIVVKDLIRINKGTILIESKPGSGTSVRFSLPGKP